MYTLHINPIKLICSTNPLFAYDLSERKEEIHSNMGIIGIIYHFRVALEK